MKNKVFVFLIILLLFPYIVNAEKINVDKQISWGGSDEERFDKIFQTSDGGFLAYGFSLSTDIEDIVNKGNKDGIIVKYDVDGKMLWQTSWGGNGNDKFSKMIECSDGGLVAIGYTYSTDIEEITNKGTYDAVIVKYDSDGKLQWQTSWGGNDGEEFNDVIQTSTGDFIIIGYTYSTDIEGLSNKGEYDAIVLKYDKDGKFQWQTSWGGNKGEEFDHILEMKDGGYIIHGFSYSTDVEELSNNGEYDAVIIKYDEEGTMLWQKSFAGDKGEEFNEILVTSDGGFLGVGFSYSTNINDFTNNGSRDAIIIKYNKNGVEEWKNSFGGNDSDSYKKVLQTQDEGFVVLGFSYSTNIENFPNKGSYDTIIVKYDKNGNLIWKNIWGGNKGDELNDILLTHDDGIISYGHTYSTDIVGMINKGSYDAVIVKYDKEGNLVWQNNWGSSKGDEFDSAVQVLNDSLFALGYTYSTDIEGLINKGNRDVVIVKYLIEYDIEENVTSQNGISTVEKQGATGIIKPTPNKGYEVDKIIIKDKNGNILDVEVNESEDGTYSFELNTDVSVEVLFKEKIENPKTGLLDIAMVLLVGFSMSLCGFLLVKHYSQGYGL